MYELIPPTPTATLLARWAKPLERYAEVVGYSHLGSIFLRSSPSLEYLVLHPLRSGSNAKQNGRFDSVAAFWKSILQDGKFVSEFLRPSDLAELAKRLGSLKEQEVYYPVPYPCIGGSGALSTYDKGNVWVFMELLGQTIGVGE